MGFGRILGYIFSVIWILASLILLPYSLIWIWAPIAIIIVLRRQANREKYARLIEEDIKKQGKQFEIQPTDIQQKESLQALLDYCFQHADRPNPLQDLIDKGFLSPNFKGETCLSVRQMYNEVENRIREQLENLTAEQNKYYQYQACANNQSTTYEECNRIFNGTK